jgi:hypothetical protein
MTRKQINLIKSKTKNKHLLKRIPFWLIPTIVMFLISVFLIGMILKDPSAPPSTPVHELTGTYPKTTPTQSPDADLMASVIKAVKDGTDGWDHYDWSVDNVIYNVNESEALLWLAPTERETGVILGTEPRRAIAILSAEQNQWQVLLEDDPHFQQTLNQSSLLLKDYVMQSAPPDENKVIEDGPVYGGYYLPWQAGLTKRLTWSISHSSCYPVALCTYAFDFADGSMFPLKAAKPGLVFHWKDTCTNGATDCTNSITLEDRSTTPWTYQIYLHLAQNSIPSALKVVGTPVSQGQQIALVDDTGASSGHHVHFMVVTENTLYRSSYGYYFGYSVDITFRDVFINWDAATQGGRPRLPEEAEEFGGEGQTFYTSGNVYRPLTLKLFLPLVLNH